MKMSKERNIIYLAGLLHDIGKFYQLADKNGHKKLEQLNSNIKMLEAKLCPLDNGVNFNEHILWTAQFLDEHKSVFTQLFGESTDEFINVAISYRQPENNILHQIIHKAFLFSSSFDSTSSGARKTNKLVPLLGTIGKNSNECNEHIPIEEASLSKSNFPTGNSKSDSGEYMKLWENFCSEFKTLPFSSFDSFTISLTSLLLRYTSCIPSGTNLQNDISLYDHLNSTAAYAICFYDYVKGENKDILSLTDNDDVFLLIGGDVSGIQNFIYDIISKGAAKNLKGRSFYLQLLVDTIIHDLLVELALPNNCVVYASGGGFYILAPNVGHTINKIKELRHKISKGLFEQHGTALAISMATQTIKIKDLKQNNLPTVWRELSLSLGIGKSTKFFDLIAENPALFFNPAAFDNSLKRDAISGTPIQGTFVNLEETESKDDKGNQIFLGESNNVLLELGKKLKTADYLILSNHVIPEWKDLEIFRISPLKNNTTWYLLSEEKLLKFKDKIKSTSQPIIVSRLNDFSGKHMKYFGINSAYRNTLYGGNQYPSKSNGEPKTFDELCGDTTGSLRRLGVLRMDVDNLGKLFINGFTQGNSSLSRYSSLSRNLDFFFKGYLNKIWEGDQHLNEKTSIIYAGGDDLFIVGHWNETIRFAKLIREEFKKWTCDNPNLSISGGVAIVSKKFPIAKGALLAGDAEDMAKDHTYQAHSKNTFTFMDIPLHWEYELPYVEKLKDELISKIGTQKEISKGFINKIATLHFLSTEQEKKGANQSWKWMMAYDFARAIKELKNDDVKDFLQTLKVDTFANTIDGKKNLSKHSTLSLYNLAARWAELIIRE